MAVKHPKFERQNRAQKKRVREAWRKPRGIDNKQRVMLRSTGALPRIGYRGKREARGLLRCGLRERLVFNEKDLLSLDSDKEAARIGASVGARKRKAIIAKASELGVKLLN